MPLRLLVTRPQPQADAWVERLRAHGVDAVALPLLAIDAVADQAALHAAWHELPRYALAMFVSPNAVAHFFAARPSGTAAPAWPAGTRAGAPGLGTLQALQAAGVPAALCVAPPPDAMQFDSAALWSQLRDERWAGRQVLVLRGNGGREEFAAHLRQAGATLQYVQAYHRRPATLDTIGRVQLALATAEPDQHLWWLSSAEAVGTLAQWTSGADWRSAQALACHPRIAARARDFGFGRVIEAAPTLNAVLAALARLRAA
jgi:uroporphyrinogen-III synthase